jgi:small subunit ribosomal protein S15
VDPKSKTDIINEYQHHATDSGSTDVQVALLTHRISELTDHLQTHRHDHATRRGLLMLVGRRRRLLRYLRSKDSPRYKEVIASLGLRG